MTYPSTIRGLRTYESRLWLPFPVEKTFAFFSDVENLDRVTPNWFRFEVLSEPPADLSPGLELDYILRWRKIPLRWRSRIVAIEPPLFFSYVQARGPYRYFQHEHTYRTHDGGTLAIDRLSYKVWGGGLVDRALVRRDLNQIFEHRKTAALDQLPDWIERAYARVGR